MKQSGRVVSEIGVEQATGRGMREAEKANLGMFALETSQPGHFPAEYARLGAFWKAAIASSALPLAEVGMMVKADGERATHAVGGGGRVGRVSASRAGRILRGV